MRGPRGRARHVLPSPEAEDRAAAAPAGSCPGPGRSGAQRGLRGAVLAALHRPCARGSLRDPSGRGGLSVFGADDVPDPGREPGGPGAPGSAQPPEPPEAGDRGACAQRGVVLGHHAAPGAGEVAVLLSLRHSGHLQPLRHGLDGGGPGDRGPGRAPDRGNLPQAGRPAPGAHASFGQGISP